MVTACGHEVIEDWAFSMIAYPCALAWTAADGHLSVPVPGLCNGSPLLLDTLALCVDRTAVLWVYTVHVWLMRRHIAYSGGLAAHMPI